MTVLGVTFFLPPSVSLYILSLSHVCVSGVYNPIYLFSIYFNLFIPSLIPSPLLVYYIFNMTFSAMLPFTPLSVCLIALLHSSIHFFPFFLTFCRPLLPKLLFLLVALCICYFLPHWLFLSVAPLLVRMGPVPAHCGQ